MRRLIFAAALAAAPLAFADLDPDQLAKIEREKDEALADVAKKHGDKKPSEMDAAERKQLIQEQAAAERAVLEKNGVSAKEYARGSAKLSRDGRDQMKKTSKELEEKAKADKAAAEAAKNKKGEIPIQRGFNNRNPVEVEGATNANGEPVVEQGLPPDEEEAAAMDRANASGGGKHKSKKGR